MTGAGHDKPMLARGLFDRFFFLYVIGDNDGRDRALGLGNTEGTVDHMTCLHGVGHGFNVGSDIAEQVGQVDFLLVTAPQGRTFLLPHDGHDGLVIELCVIEPIEQMYGTGPRGRQANAHALGELGVTTGHERRGLLVPALDKADRVVPVHRT